MKQFLSFFCLLFVATSTFAQQSDIDATKDTWKPYYQDVQPAKVVDSWKIPFEATNRSDPKGITIVSVFGAPRTSYKEGHIHTAIDIVPTKKQALNNVYAMANGVVCSIHLSHPHWTIVVKHKLKDGQIIYTSYKHLQEVYVKTGMQVDPSTKLARIYTRQEAKQYGGYFDHLHLEIRKSFEDYGCASWLTMTKPELNKYFYDPQVFIKANVK